MSSASTLAVGTSITAVLIAGGTAVYCVSAVSRIEEKVNVHEQDIEVLMDENRSLKTTLEEVTIVMEGLREDVDSLKHQLSRLQGVYKKESSRRSTKASDHVHESSVKDTRTSHNKKPSRKQKSNSSRRKKENCRDDTDSDDIEEMLQNLT